MARLLCGERILNSKRSSSGCSAFAVHVLALLLLSLLALLISLTLLDSPYMHI